jgi:hypothetical protein
MTENESSDQINAEWNSISERVEALGKRVDANLARAEKLLVDIEFLRLMYEEDMI